MRKGFEVKMKDAQEVVDDEKDGWKPGMSRDYLD